MTIEEMNKKLEELKESIDKALAEVTEYEELIRQIKEKEEPKFERRVDERYYAVETNTNNGKAQRYNLVDNSIADGWRYKNNNYFYTEERAQEVADKINFLLKLERLHDIYCPAYIPDWENMNERKYYVFYHHQNTCYSNDFMYNAELPLMVCFPTEEIVQKVCDILNKEREENDERR